MNTNAALAVSPRSCSDDRKKYDRKGETAVNDLEQDVLKAKGNDDVLADLIEANRSFILRCASETTHRYITDSDDEWSVALLAFSEAVRDYEGEKGSFRGSLPSSSSAACWIICVRSRATARRWR